MKKLTKAALLIAVSFLFQGCIPVMIDQAKGFIESDSFRAAQRDVNERHRYQYYVPPVAYTQPCPNK